MSEDSYDEICKYFAIDRWKNQFAIVRKKLLRNILVIRYVTRYSLGSDVLNY